MRGAPLALTALLAAALAGCGEDTTESSGSTTVQPGQPVVVAGDEYSFKPGEVTVRGASGPTPIRFELRNEGTLPHDLHVRRDDDDLGGTDAIGEGENATASVRLAPGEYEIFCSIGDHAELGMTGDLKIE
jgi:plastocyanin